GGLAGLSEPCANSVVCAGGGEDTAVPAAEGDPGHSRPGRGEEFLCRLPVPNAHQPGRAAGRKPFAVDTGRDARPLDNPLIRSLEAANGFESGCVPGDDISIMAGSNQAAAVGAEGYGSKVSVPGLASEGLAVSRVPYLQLAERRLPFARGDQ